MIPCIHSPIFSSEGTVRPLGRLDESDMLDKVVPPQL